MADVNKKGLWLLRMHYRMRTASFAMVFAATCFQLYGKGFSPLVWAYLVALLLVYPQLQFLYAQRAANRINVAMGSLLLDSFLLGTFCVVVRFSDWLSFSVVLATLMTPLAVLPGVGVKVAV